MIPQRYSRVSVRLRFIFLHTVNLKFHPARWGSTSKYISQQWSLMMLRSFGQLVISTLSKKLSNVWVVHSTFFVVKCGPRRKWGFRCVIAHPHRCPCSRSRAGLLSRLRAFWGVRVQRVHRCSRCSPASQTAGPGYLDRRDRRVIKVSSNEVLLSHAAL